MITPPFVTQLRSRSEPLRIAGNGPAITVRVEMPEVWDTVKVVVPAGEPIRSVKTRALEALYPSGMHDDFVLKLRGWEVLDESMPLDAAGVVDGSIFLLSHRFRRPVR